MHQFEPWNRGVVTIEERWIVTVTTSSGRRVVIGGDVDREDAVELAAMFEACRCSINGEDIEDLEMRRIQ
ncbi:MAG: hypothetical protein OES79_14620 [Planctomycetota bacterium]|nr:hypothetical protein [Planctomycetota bacterium]